MTSIQQAQSYLTRYGWGAHGKSLGITRMFQESDIGLLKSIKAVAALRPRGVLSGFLVIVPTALVYIPPITGKQQPFCIRARIAESLQKDGAILSAYCDNGDIVIEDVLVWKGKALFQTSPFDERWNRLMELLELWVPDEFLQGCCIRFSEYMALNELTEPGDRQILEFVPLSPNTKRIIWVPTDQESKNTTWIAKRESTIGPDIFSLWSETGEKQSQLALVRTLAISKLLRLHPVDEFRVHTSWNKLFERWEIVGVAK